MHNILFLCRVGGWIKIRCYSTSTQTNDSMEQNLASKIEPAQLESHWFQSSCFSMKLRRC